MSARSGTSLRSATAAGLALLLSLAELPAGAQGEPRPRLVFKDRLTPHWIDGGRRFWYRNELADGAAEFVVVDAEGGVREAAFDHRRLAAALSEVTGAAHRGDRLPFERIAYTGDRRAVLFAVGGTTWRCDLTSYRCEESEAVAALEAAGPEPGARRRGAGRRRGRRGGAERAGPVASPDGAATALVRDGDVFVRAGDGGEEVRLTDDGEAGGAWGALEWSPDSRALLAWRIERAERREVHLIESSPPGGGRARRRTRGYALPGDPFTKRVPAVFDVATGARATPAVDPFESEWARPRVRWLGGGGRFAYEQVDRGHQRFRVIEVDTRGGDVRNLVDETTDTFVWTAHTESVRLRRVHWLERTDEMILASERDGWRHLYLVDAASAATRRITGGEWVVRGVDHVDEERRQVWFSASGMDPEQDPYFVHHYRIGFDGTGLVALTEGDGHHTVRYSPDRRFLVDTYSRVDLPPVHELRRTSDGGLVCRLEEADVSRLLASGFRPPEVFVAKGRDGATDIWGILCRPADFDPEKSYPVIEDIYAGPQSAFVPKSFSARNRWARLCDLGFVVVKIDGMGTAHRSKAFHDVCWKNLADAGFPDRILWMKAAAAKYPYLDLTRVGVYGTSAGGQNAAAAVLFYPDFYKVAVANCGCHDNRMDKASWNEQWMGYPVGPQYAECSNIDNAHRLRGKLFLIVGEMDTNVPPESTLRFADALIRAGKDFDLLVVPGAGHGARTPWSGDYVTRRTHDFFVRQLLGVEPPDRNAAPSPVEAPRGPGASRR